LKISEKERSYIHATNISVSNTHPTFLDVNLKLVLNQ